jgi:molecular chaperone HscC
MSGDRARLLPNALGELSTPSVVSVLDDGQIVVGRAAKERLYTHPEVTAAAFKRAMGTRKHYDLGGHSFDAVELSALILKSLKADAEASLGEPVTEAVISVPAYFNDRQRRATVQAGELAGLRVERLVAEPTAAALAYGLNESGSDQQVLVFDLGGGTFDVSIVEMFDQVLEVKAVAGDSFLGGEDFDNAIAEYFVRTVDLDDKLRPKTRAIIKEKAESAKCALNDSEAVEMRVVLDGVSYTATLTQATLEEIAQPILERIRRPVQRALRDASLQLAELTNVILVGGASRLMVVRSYALRLFDRLPLASVDPDQTVALGAGIAAGLKERNVELAEHVVTDVCPFTLGTEVVNDDGRGGWIENIYLPIIERNTVVPCSRMTTVATTSDNQTSIEVTVYQGESRKADENLELGKLQIKVPPKPKGTALVDIRYTYDINGLLEVDVTSQDTKKTTTRVIVNSDNQLTPAEIAAALSRMSALKVHPRDQAENQAVLARAERIFEETLGELREVVGANISVFERALGRQDPSLVAEAREELTEILNQIEAML